MDRGAASSVSFIDYDLKCIYLEQRPSIPGTTAAPVPAPSLMNLLLHQGGREVRAVSNHLAHA
jgi:hypothetical protein